VSSLLGEGYERENLDALQTLLQLPHLHTELGVEGGCVLPRGDQVSRVALVRVQAAESGDHPAFRSPSLSGSLVAGGDLSLHLILVLGGAHPIRENLEQKSGCLP
jgi:hypothetical protein